MNRCFWLVVLGLLTMVPIGFCPPPPPPPVARLVVDFASAQGFFGVGEDRVSGFPKLMMTQGENGTVQIVLTRTSIIPNLNVTVRLWFYGRPPNFDLWQSTWSQENMSLPEGITGSVSPSGVELSTDTPTSANLTIVAGSNAKVGDFRLMVDAWISPTLYHVWNGTTFDILINPNGTLSRFQAFMLEVTASPDLNRDGTADILDITIVAEAFRSRPGDANWNPVADLNGDSVVNIIDLSLLARSYGKAISVLP
jgi:hypothetical protein